MRHTDTQEYFNYAGLRRYITLPEIAAEFRGYSLTWKLAVIVIDVVALTPFVVLIILLTLGALTLDGVLLCAFLLIVAAICIKNYVKTFSCNALPPITA